MQAVDIRAAGIGASGIVMAFLALFPAARPTQGEMIMTMSLQSAAFEHEGPIPAKYTCDADDVSPALTWTGIPGDARSLALIVDDPDAPDPAAPKMTWVHWVLYDLPADTGGLPEGVGALPAGTREGVNDWKRTGYGGPCPPIGQHRYFFRLYALDTLLGDLEKPSRKTLDQAMAGHVLGEAVLMGTYRRTP